MKKLLKEPLLHFLVLGAAIFVVHARMGTRDSNEPGKIVISEGQIAAMAGGFSRTWRRPPTREELKGLIRDRVQEEVYCREAMALGLDKDDTVIRRRLRQKMEFVSDDIAATAQPSDDELDAYLKAHADTFRVQRQFTFSHVYLNPEKHGENMARDTARLLAELNRPGGNADIDAAALGDAFLLEHTFTAVSGTEIAKQFGGKFEKELGRLAPGGWQGPVESGYGVHLVFLAVRTEGRVPALSEVRSDVQREWANAQRLEANGKFYQSLLKHYEVTIERPKAVEAKRIAEAGVK